MKILNYKILIEDCKYIYYILNSLIMLDSMFIIL